MNSSPVVSIVIVCMNNLKNLFPCLNSIKEYTQISYEVWVVAYLFSEENLNSLRKSYSWIKIIESNEIRGFSENNNLALQQVKGKYCFVLNDDTEMRMPVLNQLVNTIEYLPEDVAVVSPVTIFPDGSPQSCGRPLLNWKHFILMNFHLWNENCDNNYVNKSGVFKSYNIVGAAFLIKTDLLRKMGWFDETYFFCPEDIALSTLLNKSGYSCFVNADVKIVHNEGMSGRSLSLVQAATRPAARRGALIFYSEGKVYLYVLLSVVSIFVTFSHFMFHFIKSIIKKRPNEEYILMIGDLNILKTSFSTMTTKEIFLKFYSLYFPNGYGENL